MCYVLEHKNHFWKRYSKIIVFFWKIGPVSWDRESRGLGLLICERSARLTNLWNFLIFVLQQPHWFSCGHYILWFVLNSVFEPAPVCHSIHLISVESFVKLGSCMTTTITHFLYAEFGRLFGWSARLKLTRLTIFLWTVETRTLGELGVWVKNCRLT